MANSIYNLDYFMEFPNLAFKLAMVEPFRRKIEPHQSFLGRLFSSLGPANLIYQGVGVIIGFLITDNASEDIILQISETGSVLGLTIVAICKMIILSLYRKNISQLMDEFESIFPGTHKPHRCCHASHYQVKHFATSSRTLMRQQTLFFTFAFFVYNLLPIGESFVEWIILGRDFQHRFQSTTWYPWNGSSGYSFALNYFCQVMSSFTGAAFITAGEFLLCFFLTQMRMHFDFLATTLETLDAKESETDPEFLKFIVTYHSTLMRLSREINHIYNISFLVNFATSSVAICLMGCSIVMGITLVSAVRFSIILLAFVLFTMFICYNGSEFTQTSARLHSAAFYHNWYDAGPAYRKTILFIMMRAAKPSMLQAYKFSIVSMETFMNILKFSYQLFTFLRAV